jgi:hypothetical protein
VARQTIGAAYDQVTQYADGAVYCISQPFGTHITVSAFGGENLYSLLVTGGHTANYAVIKQICDSPIEVTHFTDSGEALRAFLSLMPHKAGEPDSLRAAVQGVLRENLKIDW